jgi:hypothetical protein
MSLSEMFAASEARFAIKKRYSFRILLFLTFPQMF